jgi:ArsR family transcriptional regulator, arsenate/arsenite/antimonite-responsive transcriptional repressor
MAQNIFVALSDPTRRAVLRMLRQGSRAAGDIADAFELSKPTMSHHLRVLKGAGLVRAERQGTSIVYTLQSNVVEDAVAELMGMMATPIKKRART